MNHAALALLAAIAAAGLAQDAPAREPLRLSVQEGDTLNELYRDGPAAAHLVLRSGAEPRLVVAFPAGNSGAALWFDTGEPWTWQPEVTLAAASHRVADGAALHGVTAELSGRGKALAVREAVLGSVRVIRDYEHSGSVPPEVATRPGVEGARIVWERRRLDGAAGYRLVVEVLQGAVTIGARGQPVFEPDADGRLRLRVTALTGDAPLAPLEVAELLTAGAAADQRLRRILAFLSYRETLLAGSWRFNTYFGRDTLMTLRLLSPVATPLAMETGLAAVLRRLSPDGEVAHEEEIGEFAVLQRRLRGLPAGDAPLYDYKMLDDDFMLAPVAAHYLLDRSDGRRRAAEFLAADAGTGTARGRALARNLRRVVAAGARFAGDPQWPNLIALPPGQNVGNWRDSEAGLGGGRYPYDVNCVWVPAALAAGARLLESGLLDPYLDAPLRQQLERGMEMAQVWLREAPRLFRVELAPERARDAVRAGADRLDLDASAALAALGRRGLAFHAVALDERGHAIPVQHSDEAFALLFLELAPREAARIAETLTRPFPAGLMTDAGLLVANPVFGPERLQRGFDRSHYHGTVVWSWQQALLGAGLRRQLAREDLPAAARGMLERAAAAIEAAIAATAPLRGSELWSWAPEAGAIRAVPFGRQQGHETESNAAQLWSTVHLARPAD